MGIVKSIYDENLLEDKVWYDSSNIYFSRFVENKDDNFGSLYITFTNGSTYVYKHVDMPTDYILFKHGGLDGSQGKTLNKLIKGKYEFEKVTGIDIHDLERELFLLNNNDKDIANTYFISGHGDISDEEFENFYTPELTLASEDEDSKFVVGDFRGVDIMAQKYLIDVLQVDPSRITVYHMFESPREKHTLITNTVGGFVDDESRDSAMTKASSYDIAFIRKGKEQSCTAKNILRRHLMN